MPDPRPKRHSRRPVLRRTTFLRRNLPYYALSGFTDAANRKEGVKVAARPRASLALCRLMPTHRAAPAYSPFIFHPTQTMDPKARRDLDSRRYYYKP